MMGNAYYPQIESPQFTDQAICTGFHEHECALHYASNMLLLMPISPNILLPNFYYMACNFFIRVF